MLITAETVDLVRSHVQSWRENKQVIAFVATMGNLHAGHMRLVDEAREKSDRVVVSIFVNPSQFAEGEDYTRYPRTLQQDLEKLIEYDVDLVFIPAVGEMYASPNLTIVNVNDLSGQLCGEFRPGHFSGVATVVCKLFNIVQPDLAVFGEKDYQQLVLIRTMVSDLKKHIEIVGVPTVRSDDGLAMSSRNQYLTTEQRKQAVQLYQTLCSTRNLLKTSDNIDYRKIEDQQFQHLKRVGFKPDYFAIRNAETLAHPSRDDNQQTLVILVAAWLGQTRLIDNLLV